jgi:hypothetical protein
MVMGDPTYEAPGPQIRAKFDGTWKTGDGIVLELSDGLGRVTKCGEVVGVIELIEYVNEGFVDFVVTPTGRRPILWTADVRSGTIAVWRALPTEEGWPEPPFAFVRG